MEQLKVISTCKHTHIKDQAGGIIADFQLSEELDLLPTSHTLFLGDQD